MILLRAGARLKRKEDGDPLMGMNPDVKVRLGRGCVYKTLITHRLWSISLARPRKRVSRSRRIHDQETPYHAWTGLRAGFHGKCTDRTSKFSVSPRLPHKHELLYLMQ